MTLSRHTEVLVLVWRVAIINVTRINPARLSIIFIVSTIIVRRAAPAMNRPSKRAEHQQHRGTQAPEKIPSFQIVRQHVIQIRAIYLLLLVVQCNIKMLDLWYMNTDPVSEMEFVDDGESIMETVGRRPYVILLYSTCTERKLTSATSIYSLTLFVGYSSIFFDTHVNGNLVLYIMCMIERKWRMKVWMPKI